jgi:hypothetical protein
MANIFVAVAPPVDELFIPVRLGGLKNINNEQRFANIIELQLPWAQ